MGVDLTHEARLEYEPREAGQPRATDPRRLFDRYVLETVHCQSDPLLDGERDGVATGEADARVVIDAVLVVESRMWEGDDRPNLRREDEIHDPLLDLLAPYDVDEPRGRRVVRI
ncbi:MAG TPA: hypothetical protein VF592_00315 [Sphingomonas sp.]|jgi:hypothetical protein|uniref:hypothetical protein n=1 Tax=Sphingomonas sp. TaxID=28214 RepID=UPI002EDB87B5